MKKQICAIIILSLAQGAIAMEPQPPHAHAQGYAEGAGPSHAEVYRSPIYIAAEEGDYNKVAKLLKEGADANTKGDYDESALGAAARRGHENIVKLLLRNHALVDAQSSEGATPLMRAATPHIVKLLLRAGADINAMDKNDRSALTHAIIRGSFWVTQSLLENGANINTTDTTNTNPVYAATPLMAAAESGNEELVMLLLVTPARKMIIRAFAGIKAIQKSQKPARDVLWLLKKELVAKLVQDQMDRIRQATTNSIGRRQAPLNASDFAYMTSHPNLGILLDPNNPASVARIRHSIEENINRLIFGEPQEKLEPAQGLTQEEVDEAMGSWLPERE
jgi:hypothetical protein